MYDRQHTRLFLVLVMLLILFMIPLGDAQADVGLPPSQPGSSLSPGEYETRVQMVSEQVEIIIPEKSPEEWMAKAYVTADFQMFNHGDADESIEVWFPFGERSDYPKGWKVIQVTDFQAWVDGQEMEVTIEESDQWLIIWAHWPTVFPADESVDIRVSYTITENLIGGGPYNFHSFYYIMETGAGWEGVIEEALITVQVPYPVDEADEFLGGPIFHARPEGYIIEGNKVRWVLRDLEPVESDNIEVHLLHQDIRKTILAARQALESDPSDWEASYQLAKGLRAWMGAQSSLVSGGFIETAPDLQALEQLTADCYRQFLDNSPPDLDGTLTALDFYRWYPSLIDSRDLQDYFYQAVSHFPDNEQLGDYYQRAIDEGRIGEGEPPSPTPQPTSTAIPTLPPTATLVEIPAGSGTSNPVYFILGLVLFFCAILMIMFAVWRRRTD